MGIANTYNTTLHRVIYGIYFINVSMTHVHGATTDIELQSLTVL